MAPLSVAMNDLPEISVPKDLIWEGTFEDYLTKVIEHPFTVRTAHQRLSDAMHFYGKDEYTFLRRKVIRYRVFEDPFTSDHRHAVYGRNVEMALMKFMRILRAAAKRLGQERRMYLLRGPVGTAKSTLAELIACALEDYTCKPEGQLFSPVWIVDEKDEEGMEILGTLTRRFERNRLECPLHEEPLRILPIEIRKEVLNFMDRKLLSDTARHSTAPFFVEGNSCPLCASIFKKFMRRYNHDWKMVVDKHLRTQRYLLSKAERHGIVVTRPKSEKDQDVTEFLGAPNYANLGAFGSIVDPRSFDWSGHYMSGNRGGIIFEEQLKFALAFLYDCLGATQEHRVQPRGFMEVDVDLFILGTTNMPEYKKLLQDEKMEALRDRMIMVDIPYILKHSDEIKIYEKFFSKERTGGKHIAPRTLYLAAYYGLLTRLKKPTNSSLSVRDKLKLYDGRQVVGFTEDAIPEMQKAAEEEGLEGISPRYIHDKISAACMVEDDKDCVNFFTVVKELKDGLQFHQHITSQELRKHYETLIDLVTEEMNERITEDIQDAATMGEEEMLEIYERYISHITAFVNKEKVRNPITDEDEDPDDGWMKLIEGKIGITDHADFRQKILNQMQKRALERERDSSKPKFDYRTDERLYRALRLHLFDQVKEKINWERLISRKAIADRKDKGDGTEADRIVDKVKANLMKMNFGPEREKYCETCSTEVLVYFASTLTRAKKK